MNIVTLPWLFFFQAILHFVNQNLSSLGLQVIDLEKQVSQHLLLPCFHWLQITYYIDPLALFTNEKLLIGSPAIASAYQGG